MLIRLTNKKALKLLYDMEELNLIEVLNKSSEPSKSKLSEKYKGVFSKEDAVSFNQHTQNMRNEWNGDRLSFS